VAQRDDFPIGPLLPPTVWGERRPEIRLHGAATAGGDLADGRYEVQVALYNPADMQVAQYQTPAGEERRDPLTLATVDVNDTDIIIAAP
jgi:hypothetical protein